MYEGVEGWGNGSESNEIVSEGVYDRMNEGLPLRRCRYPFPMPVSEQPNDVATQPTISI